MDYSFNFLVTIAPTLEELVCSDTNFGGADRWLALDGGYNGLYFYSRDIEAKEEAFLEAVEAIQDYIYFNFPEDYFSDDFIMYNI